MVVLFSFEVEVAQKDAVAFLTAVKLFRKKAEIGLGPFPTLPQVPLIEPHLLSEIGQYSMQICIILVFIQNQKFQC